MLTDEMVAILDAAEADGWVLEPEAKRLFKLAGLTVPNFQLAETEDGAVAAAEKIGYPVAVKAVSPAVVHKTDFDAVQIDIKSADAIRSIFTRYSGFDKFKGMLVEEMVSGVELIVGTKIDHQFGPVVLLGIGGTGVELYGDTAVRMAPLNQSDVRSMVHQLKGRQVLTGFRGSEPVDMVALGNEVVRFSELVMALANRITSIDLNPVMCSASGCVVADARIMLTEHGYKPN